RALLARGDLATGTPTPAGRGAPGGTEGRAVVLDAARRALLRVLRDDPVARGLRHLAGRRRGLVAAHEHARRQVRVAEALVHRRRLRGPTRREVLGGTRSDGHHRLALRGRLARRLRLGGALLD